jgi:hypothetical protein
LSGKRSEKRGLERTHEVYAGVASLLGMGEYMESGEGGVDLIRSLGVCSMLSKGGGLMVCFWVGYCLTRTKN